MRVLLLLNQGFETMESAPFFDVCGWARAECGEDIAVVTVGQTQTVTSTFGMPVQVDALLQDGDAAGFDALAIPGGFEAYGFYEAAYSQPVAALIQAFVAAGKPVASVCVGALALGHAGVLQGKKATTYHLGGRRQKQLAVFGAQVVNQPLVVDARIATSRCPQTAPAVAFWLLGELLGAALTKRVQHLMGYV